MVGHVSSSATLPYQLSVAARDAEVLIEHLRLVPQRGRRALEHEAPGRQHVDLVGDGERELQVLLDQQDGVAAFAQPPHDLLDLQHQSRRQAFRRLVHQDELGVGHQRPSDRQHLLLAAAERTARMVDALAELREFLDDLVEIPALAGPLPRPLLGAREHARRQQQVLAHAERAENAPSLRDDRNAAWAMA